MENMERQETQVKAAETANSTGRTRLRWALFTVAMAFVATLTTGAALAVAGDTANGGDGTLKSTTEYVTSLVTGEKRQSCDSTKTLGACSTQALFSQMMACASDAKAATSEGEAKKGCCPSAKAATSEGEKSACSAEKKSCGASAPAATSEGEKKACGDKKDCGDAKAATSEGEKGTCPVTGQACPCPNKADCTEKQACAEKKDCAEKKACCPATAATSEGEKSACSVKKACGADA